MRRLKPEIFPSQSWAGLLKFVWLHVEGEFGKVNTINYKEEVHVVDDFSIKSDLLSHLLTPRLHLVKAVAAFRATHTPIPFLRFIYTILRKSSSGIVQRIKIYHTILYLYSYIYNGSYVWTDWNVGPKIMIFSYFASSYDMSILIEQSK